MDKAELYKKATIGVALDQAPGNCPIRSVLNRATGNPNSNIKKELDNWLDGSLQVDHVKGACMVRCIGICDLLPIGSSITGGVCESKDVCELFNSGVSVSGEATIGRVSSAVFGSSLLRKIR